MNVREKSKEPLPPATPVQIAFLQTNRHSWNDAFRSARDQAGVDFRDFKHPSSRVIEPATAASPCSRDHFDNVLVTRENHYDVQ